MAMPRVFCFLALAASLVLGADEESCLLQGRPRKVAQAARAQRWARRVREHIEKEGKPCRFKNKPRVRREWRTLDEVTKHNVAKAFWTLKKFSTKEGQAKYGQHFHNYDDMLFLHSCSTMDPRCDQGHFGPQFMTFHRLLLLKVELALLSVDPSIEAMPYWNMAYDAVGGKFRNRPDKYIFSDKYFGSFWGTGPNHQVEDGLFAYWPIAIYNESRFGSGSALQTADGKNNKCVEDEFFKPTPCNCTGTDDVSGCPTYLRNHDDCTPTLCRWPQDPTGQMGTMEDGTVMNPDGMGGSWEIIYNESNFDACRDPKRTPTWMQWQDCIEMSTSSCLVPGSTGYMLFKQVMPSMFQQMRGKKHDMGPLMEFLKNHTNCTDMMMMGFYQKQPGKRGYAPFLHSHAHIKFGKDLLDVTTSPNDPGAFSGYHAYIDASNFGWMLEASRTIRKANWTYPWENTTEYTGRRPHGVSGPVGKYDKLMCSNDTSHFYDYTGTDNWLPGTMYDDVVNGGFAFYNLFTCAPWESCDGGETGYTHKDVLYWTSPERTPYTYDMYEHHYY